MHIYYISSYLVNQLHYGKRKYIMSEVILAYSNVFLISLLHLNSLQYCKRKSSPDLCLV